MGAFLVIENMKGDSTVNSIFPLDLIQQCWAALVPLVILLLLKQEERIRELLKKALIAYGLGWITYELVRLTAYSTARDNLFVLDVKVFLTYIFLELAWKRIHPDEDEDVPALLIQAFYVLGAIVSFVGVVLSFLGYA